MDHHVQPYDTTSRLRSRATENRGLAPSRPDTDDRSLLCRSLATLLFMGVAGSGVWGQESSSLPGLPLDDLLLQARFGARPLYLYLGPCDSAAIACLERHVWSDSVMQFLLDSVYVAGRVDIATPEGRAIARRYGLDHRSAGHLPWHLFIAPGGDILHRTRGPEEGATSFAQLLAQAAENALVVDGQYYGLRRRYEMGEKGDDLLLKYAVAAREAHAPEAERIAREYADALEAIMSRNATTDPGMPPPESRRRGRR